MKQYRPQKYYKYYADLRNKGFSAVEAGTRVEEMYWHDLNEMARNHVNNFTAKEVPDQGVMVSALPMPVQIDILRRRGSPNAILKDHDFHDYMLKKFPNFAVKYIPKKVSMYNPNSKRSQSALKRWGINDSAYNIMS